MLELEEALLRADDQPWCLVNFGTPDAIVMGVSGKPEMLIDVPRAKASGIPVIQRFSGGGTVVVDHNTLFITWITDEPPFQPKPILRWAEKRYHPLFDRQDFHLEENDFVFGDKKFGGNAQYIRKERWLLHTSFLWDYSVEKMDLLLMPEKRPAYRESRKHTDFLTKLCDHYPSIEHLLDRLREQVGGVKVELSSMSDYLQRDYRHANRIIEI